MMPCAIPTEEGRASGLARFGLKFSMKLESRQLSAMARTGIFTADLSFPMRVPAMVRLQEAVRDFANRRSQLNPLCVTAYLTLPVPGESLPDEEMSRFGRLAALPLRGRFQPPQLGFYGRFFAACFFRKAARAALHLGKGFAAGRKQHPAAGYYDHRRQWAPI